MNLPALLLVAAVWTYPGLMSDTRLKPQPSAPVVPDAPVVPPAPSPRPTPGPIPRPQPAPAPAPPAPTRWRLTDVSGQVWEHTDKAWLETFVARHNAELQAARSASPVLRPAVAPVFAPIPSRCGPSGCPR